MENTEILCILYMDTVGSTQVSVTARQSGHEAQQVAAFDRFMHLWRTALTDGEATFIKSTGDGFLATFIDPLSALNVVIQARQNVSADSLCRQLKCRVGLHIGLVRMGPHGDLTGPEAALGARIVAEAGSDQILVSDAYAAQVQQYLPDGYRLHHLGEVHLKGFEMPVRICQLCAPGCLPTRHPASPHLPVPPDRFIGRVRELKKVRQYLRDPTLRCISLVGPPGAGKTRLAVEVARKVQDDFRDGVYFVALADAADGDSLLTHVATVLRVELSSDARILHVLQSHLAQSRPLFVLDNMEQVSGAADTVVQLLEALPAVRLIVTSREPLHIRGEAIYDVEPLAVPDEEASLAQIMASDSVRLFETRIRTIDSRFAMHAENARQIAAICRTLSGLPLAIEIVAAEARYRPLARLLKEVRLELLDLQVPVKDIPARHRSLRAALDWSYTHLNESDRLLFTQLGLFETAFGEDEVYDICTVANLEGALRRLCEKSLICCDVRSDQMEFRLLPPVREYARSLLGKPVGILRQRFIAAFTRRAQMLREYYFKNAEPEALRGFRASLENIRAAWHLACEDQQSEPIADLGMAGLFFAPLITRSAHIESWADETEHALLQLKDVHRLGILYNIRARLARRQGKPAEAIRQQRLSLDYLTRKGNSWEIADAHSSLAWFALCADDFDLADRHARLAIEHSNYVDVTEPNATAYFVLARVLTPSNLNEAQRLAQSSLALFEQLQQRGGIAHAHTALAFIAQARGEYAAAEDHYRNALRLCWEQRAEVQTTHSLEAIANFHADHGDRSLAAALLDTVADMQRQLGMPETVQSVFSHDASRNKMEGSLSLPGAVQLALGLSIDTR